MGDVIHALPVVTDLQLHRPDITVDWVVEEAFADLPALHPAVRTVHRVALRRWRRELGRARTWHELAAARRALRAARYDISLDLQGLVKSAWIARWTKAPVVGFDATAAREPLAARLYARWHGAPADHATLHAIERLRRLAGAEFGYMPSGNPIFGLRQDLARPEWMPARPAVAMLHATSRAEKSWPDACWVALARACAQAGCEPLWPWGSHTERHQAERLAAAAGTGIVPPRLALSEAAAMLLHAAGTVGVDTGLMHLSAALERPTVAVFVATPAWRFGPYWTPRATSLGGDGNAPTVDAVLGALHALGGLRAAACA